MWFKDFNFYPNASLLIINGILLRQDINIFVKKLTEVSILLTHLIIRIMLSLHLSHSYDLILGLNMFDSLSLWFKDFNFCSYLSFCDIIYL
jgi:hypothetical protein